MSQTRKNNDKTGEPAEVERPKNIFVCENFKKEVEFVTRQLGISDINIFSFPARCGRPQLEITELSRLADDRQPTLIIGGICLHKIRNELAARTDTDIYIFDNCFEMVMEKKIVEYFIRKGAYLTTPGWLAEWKTHIREWKFSRKTARDFFRESCQYVLLLDTEIDAASTNNLKEFAEFIDRETEIIPVGIAPLKRFLQSALEPGTPLTSLSEAASNKRQLADYAMAVDILIRMFAGDLSEKGIIESILNNFAMLFAPAEMVYLRFVNSTPDKLYSKSGAELEDPVIMQKMAALNRPYAWQPSGNGFMLQLHFNKELLGIISIDAIACPEYKQHYLNLALFLAEVYGLAITNARKFDIINDQKEKLQSINQELSRREDYFHSLYESAPLSYQSLDGDGNLLNVNQAWCETLGYPETAVIGKWFGNFLDEGSKEKFQRTFPNFIESGNVNEIEYKMIKKNGDLIDVSFSGKVLKDADGKVLRTHCIIKDITKQKKILKTLEEAAKRSNNLEGYIPICASCNKIRDDEKEGHPWVNPSEYFASRYPDLKFSHGMCPDCMQIWYPDYSKKKKER